LNSYENRINFKVEKICSAGIWTAKKRYALNVYSNEGVVYSEPKIKVTGLEVVKSSSPKLVRSQLKQCISIILNEDEYTLQEYVKKCKDIFYNAVIYDISFPRGVNVIDTYADSQTLYRKGTPIHVRGSLVYNNFLKKNKLNTKYELIKSGDKIKFCYLKMPNPFRENVIAFNHTIPRELNVVEYIDYNKMFDKVFIEPLRALTDAIEWKIEKENTLFDFLG
jgi:DNA polymerase elongation subunit (family B)